MMAMITTYADDNTWLLLSHTQWFLEILPGKILLNENPSQILSHQANSSILFKKINTVLKNAEQITNKKGTSIDFEINQ